MDRRTYLSTIPLVLAGCSGDAASDESTTMTPAEATGRPTGNVDSPSGRPSHDDIETAREYVPSADEFELTGIPTLPYTITYRGETPIAAFRFRYEYESTGSTELSMPWQGAVENETVPLLRAGMSMETREPVSPDSTITVGMGTPARAK
jgi:hypothetical protein